MINKAKIIKDAQKFITKGQWDKAISEYDKILKDTPNDANILNTLGDLYLKKNDSDNAIESFRKAAELLNKSGFTLKAIALYKKVLNIKPDQVDIMLLMGKLNAERGMVGNANESYLAAAAYFSKQGQKDKVLGVYRTLCDLNPDNTQLAQKLAELYMSEGLEREGVSKLIEIAEKALTAGDLRAAHDAIEKAAPKGSERFDFIRVSAMLDLKENRLPEAVHKLEEARNTDRTDVRIAALIAEAYLHSGRYEDSEAVYRELLEKEPNNEVYRKQLIAVSLKSGDYDSAWKEYRNLIDGCIARSELQESERLAREFLTHRPDDIEARQVLADIYTKMGREADVSAMHKDIAEIYSDRGDTEKSGNIYRKLLEKEPENEEMKARLVALRDSKPSAKAPAQTPPQAPPAQQKSGYGFKVEGIEDASLKEVLESAAAEGPLDEEVPPADENVYELPETPEETTPEETASEQLPEIDLEGMDGLDIFGIGAEEPAVEETAPPVEEALPSAPPVEEAPSTAPPKGRQSLAEEITEVDVYIKYGFTPKAKATLDSLDQSFPSNPLVKKRYLELYKADGNMEGFVKSSIELAELYERMGMMDEAVKVLKQAIAAAPADERLMSQLAGLGGKPAPAPAPPVSQTPPEPEPFVMPIPEPEPFTPMEFEQEPFAPVQFEPEPPASAPVQARDSYLEDLSEAEFYAQQGLIEEARRIYQRILDIDPDNLDVKAKYQALEGTREEPVELETVPPPVVDTSLDDELDMAFEELDLTEEAEEEVAVKETPQPQREERIEPENEVEAEFFDLGAEIRGEMEDEEEAPVAVKPADVFQDKHLEAVFNEFKKGVEEQLSKEDYETHYNLGIAYKEMGMLDEALGEFELACKDAERGLDCASMAGLCRMEKGEYDKAIREFRAGLAVSGRDKSEYLGLKYDMAAAYELKGDIDSARAVVNEMINEDPSFRDVKDRLARLNKAVMEAVPVAAGKPEPAEPIKETKEEPKPTAPKKSKVSYL